MCDHASEQVNPEDKTHGELKGRTRNQNSRNLDYLAAPVLAQLREEIMTKGLFLVLSINNASLVRLMCIDKGCGYVLKLHELGLENNKITLRTLSLKKHFHKRHQEKFLSVRRIQKKFTMK